MTTQLVPMSPQVLSERLDRYRITLDKLRAEGADKRIIKSWEARIVKLETELKSMATDVDQNEEVAMPTAVKDKPKPQTLSKKDLAKAKQAEVAKNKVKATPAKTPKSTTATPTKPKSVQTQAAPVKQTPKKPAQTIQKSVSKAPAKKTTAKAQVPTKGIPGKNNMTYPDLNKTDPTFGGRGTIHCMCGCGEVNRRGGKFSSGHDNRFRQVLGRIERGERGGVDIAVSTLVDLKANKTLTVGSYTAKDIIKLSTRRLRKSARR